jgi:glycerophosphoryl diester phosphodiesterase
LAYKPLTIAYRGASHVAPENTLPAIKKALEADVDMISLEVQRTRDNQALVIADVSLDRTTNGTGRIARSTEKEVRALDAGNWFNPDFAGEKVPTLAEAFKAAAKSRLFLALPETRSGTPWFDALLKVLSDRANPANDVLAFSDSDSLKQVREKAPDFAYSLLLGERVDGWLYLEKADKLGLKHIRPHRSQIDSVMIGEAKQKGIQVFAYFANEEADIRAMLELRVDGVVTGRPERLHALLGELSN